MRLRDFLKLHPMFPVVILFSLAVSVTSLYLDQHLIAYAEFGLGILLAILVYFAEKKNFPEISGFIKTLLFSGFKALLYQKRPNLFYGFFSLTFDVASLDFLPVRSILSSVIKLKKRTGSR